MFHADLTRSQRPQLFKELGNQKSGWALATKSSAPLG